jgi:signal transduction histidine kinase
MPYLRHIFVILLWVVLAPISLASVEIQNPVDTVVLDGQWSFLDDPNQTLDIGDALTAYGRGAFVALTKPLGRGYTSAASWLAIDLENPSQSDQQVILRLDPQQLDHVDVYWQVGPDVSSAKSYRIQPLGDHVPAIQKPMELPFMGVPIELKANALQRVFVRVQTTSSHLMSSSLVSPQRFQREGIVRLAWLCAFQGITLWVAIMAFLEAFRLKDLTHGIYGCLPLGLCLSSIGTEGTAFVLATPIAHHINDWLVGASVALGFGGVSVFANRIFQTRIYHPFWYRYLLYLTALSLADFPASGTVWYGRITYVVMIAGLVFWVFLVWASTRMIVRGERQLGQLMLLAFMVPVLVAAVGMLRYLGVVAQSEFTQALLPLSSLVHMVFMTLALSERLSRLEAQYKNAIQEALMETEHRRDKEKLIAMLTHEIRSPVSVIRAANQSLQLLEDSASSERWQRYRRIERSIQRLSLLMDLTENHAGRESEQLGMLQQPFYPVAATRMIIGWLDEADQKRVGLDVQGSIPRIMGAERMLCFAWMNLIDNACKFSPDQSPILITISPIWSEGRSGVQWQIEDQGPGISPGSTEKIFEKYWRAGETNNAPGMGLGLYLARSIIERHGGHIIAETGRATGARFQCWLPLHSTASG